MKKSLFLLMCALVPFCAMAYNLRHVSVHDPSVVWDPNSRYYYIFGSHRASAKSKDMSSWTTFTAAWKTTTSNNASNTDAFKTNQTKKVTINGSEVTFGNFDAYAWSSAYGNGYNIDGNMWAPDVIYNPVLQKWCMYLSINGPTWNSSIILLTADKIDGPYMYQGPVIFSGFNVTSTAGVSYKKTDLELVLGEQASLPSRYNVGNQWGNRWPHCIDPCVFYDEQGKLWMSYGSWSGGIWMIELDENTGLRDYDVSYSIKGSGNGVTSDPYFGKKIAGGYYVSGEGSYIEYIGGYYFLFISYGGLAVGGNPNDYNNGGYQMRYFRSENPDGPYKDANNVDAIFPTYRLNFGHNATDNRGVNIFGAYGDWGKLTVGDWSERSQGHNSIIAAEDGRTYLVYHTRFQNRGEAHEVRVHQVFQNEDGWLVAAPFEYTGEEVKSADIATTQQIATNRVPGKYQLLTHKYRLNHTTKELAKPVEIQLNHNGTISGSVTGSWSIQEGTSYITLIISGVTYKGVVVEQTLERSTQTAVSFTAVAKNGVSIWGYFTEALSGIEDVYTDNDVADDVIYDLQGRRITTPTQKGIYIRNGRKFIWK